MVCYRRSCCYNCWFGCVLPEASVVDANVVVVIIVVVIVVGTVKENEKHC